MICACILFDSTKNGVMHSASARGNLEMVRFSLQDGVDINGQNKFNKLLQAAMLGNTTLVETLLAAGADPNVRDQASNLTVMHDAAREGFVETVRALLAHGADAHLEDFKGNQPLHVAEREGHAEVVQLLMEHAGRQLA